MNNNEYKTGKIANINKMTKILLVHAIKRVKRHYEIGKCSIFAYPIFIQHFSVAKIPITHCSLYDKRF